MDLHLIIAYFIATFFSVQSVPLPNKSVYDAIKFSEGDVNLKCPYVRTTKLLEPAPTFLSNCGNFIAAQSLTTLGPANVEDGLCLLYYDNFEHLCHASNNYTEVIKGLLSNDQIELIPTTYQNNITQVCAVLKDTQPFLKESKPVIELVRKHLENSRKCERLCTDLDINVKPICSITAYIMNVTAKLNKEILNPVGVDTKNEKAKNKPSVTDHNVEPQQDISNKLKTGANKKDTLLEAPKTGAVPEKPLEISQGGVSTQKISNPPEKGSMPKIDTPINNDRWNIFLKQPEGEKQNIGSEKSTVLKMSSTPSGVLINDQDKKPEQPRIEKEGVPSQPTSATTPPSKIKTNKDEQQVYSPSNAEQKFEIPEVPSSSPSTGSENNIAMPKLGELPSDEATGSKIKPPNEEKKQNDSKNSNTLVEKTEEVAGSAQVQPHLNALNKDTPKKDEDTVNEQEVGVEDNKLSTGIEAAGESPQDAKDQLELDGDIDPSFANDEDYNLNEDQPKSSEWKTKPVEKSKPREIDEDGPSFAANYQNQSIDDSDSYFFSYFMMVCIMFICGYVAYHNKQKILALVVEGRKGRRSSRTRRPNSANYRKLDSNLEEAVTSSCNKNATQVIY